MNLFIIDNDIKWLGFYDNHYYSDWSYIPTHAKKKMNRPSYNKRMFKSLSMEVKIICSYCFIVSKAKLLYLLCISTEKYISRSTNFYTSMALS